MLPILWTIIIGVLAVIVLGAVWVSAGRVALEDLGAVSDGWLAHHRLERSDATD